MVLSLVAVLCTGIVAVPVSWAVRKQAEAERGEPTPDAAVNVYVLQMSSGEELGLSRVLAGARHDELLRQWRSYRGELARAEVPSKLEIIAPIDVQEQGDGYAKVTAHVRGIWWSGQTNFIGGAHPWRFETRRSFGGWRVWSAQLPPWCGVRSVPTPAVERAYQPAGPWLVAVASHCRTSAHAELRMFGRDRSPCRVRPESRPCR